MTFCVLLNDVKFCLVFLHMYTCTHSHIHTFAWVHTRIYMHTHSHIYTHTRARSHTQNLDIYISCVSFAHNVCAKNFFLAMVSTTVETANPEQEISVGLDLLGPVLEK